MSDDGSRAQQIEALAKYAHDAWSGWMQYLFTRCEARLHKGGWFMPYEWADRWQQQMNTPYAELSESEKDSDRKEAQRMLDVLTALSSPSPSHSEVEVLARTFAMEFLTGHYRPLREDENQRFDQLFVVMLAFAANIRRSSPSPQHPVAAFLAKLPEMECPEICVEANGDLCFAWHAAPSCTASVWLSPDGRLGWALLLSDGPHAGHGNVEAWPTDLAVLLTQYIKRADTLALPPSPSSVVDGTCDNDWGRRCSDLWPDHHDSWCHGCCFNWITQARAERSSPSELAQEEP